MPKPNRASPVRESGFIRVRGAREHNLKDVDVDVPRNALVVFTGISGSGKSSLAFGTLFAEAQRRYFDSVSPYARRLIDQVGVPDVDSIDGLPPAVALQQARGSAGSRSTLGSVSMMSNLLRMLYSRAGRYPRGMPILHAEDFSPHTPQGACPTCQGLGFVYDVTEKAMVPDDTLSIRERAVAAWPPAWHGQNLRDILVTLGYDVDKPWRDLPRKDRDWILFTDEQPTVPVYAGFTPAETRAALRRKLEPSYQGTFTGARKYVLHTFATTPSELMKRRVSRFMSGTVCPECDGKRLKADALSVSFAGLDIGALSRLPLNEVARVLAQASTKELPPEKRIAAQRITHNVLERVKTLQDIGLGYLSLDRQTPTLSSGELQRVRLATQIHANLFGVLYVLDEPSAGLHPADGVSLLAALDRLKQAGNSLFVVEHDMAVMQHADWIVDVGPEAGEHGGHVLYSGPLDGLRKAKGSHTAHHLFAPSKPRAREVRAPRGWLQLAGVACNNLHRVNAAFPMGVLTAVTGVSGSGKSSLVGHALVDLMADHLGHQPAAPDTAGDDEAPVGAVVSAGRIAAGAEAFRRLVKVDQKPIGRTPRSNLATYTGLFDAVRKLFAAEPAARKRQWGAGRFSFNVAGGRCDTCEGEGFVHVELLFMPGVYAPCSTCGGQRYNDKTLQILHDGKNIAEVLAMTVDEATAFFAHVPAIHRPLKLLQDIGLGYLRLGQPATELSGGEAQRIKLATELQRPERGDTLYVLDEPTTGLHAADVDRLMAQLHALVDAGNTVVIVEHDMRVVAGCDWVIDVGPGAGEEGGRIVVAGEPATVAVHPVSTTAPYLAAQG
ncbi:excinuclease ABC subunit A [Hydrogenophaga sp.]|uniref:excinuclease ABC subunit A n=1 Tax=Hydrogenophaga sp. TaxID=1904254 RepID=UPI003F6F7CDC